jgi:hypothetical protein
MNEFQLGTIVEPKQYYMGKIGDDPIYADCAECGKKEAVMHGMIIGSDGHVAVRVNQDTHLARLSLFCEECWPKVLERYSVPGNEQATP